MNVGFWTLRRKMFLVLTVVALAPVIATGALMVRHGRSLLERDARDRMTVVADAATDRLDAVNQRYFDLVGALGRMPAMRDACSAIGAGGAPDRGSLDVLAVLAATDSAINSIAMTDGRGRVALTTTPAYQGFDVTRRSYYQTARARPGATVEMIIATRFEKPAPMIVIAQALGHGSEHNGDDCVLLIGVHAERIFERVRDLGGVLGEGSFVQVLDDRGIRIAHSYRDDLLFTPAGALSPDELERMVASRRFGETTREMLTHVVPTPTHFARARAATLEGQDTIHEYYSPANRLQNLSIARRMRTAHWTVFVQVPTNTIYAPSQELLRSSALVSGAALAILLLGALMMSRRIVAPIRALAVAADAVTRGGLNTRVAIHSNDELGMLANRFNKMTSSIEAATQDLERKVVERTKALQLSNQQLRDAGEELRAQQAELQAQKTELQTQRDLLEVQNTEVERANRTKSEFLANMSHELRTPLNAVIGFADLLVLTTEGRLEPDEVAQLRDIKAAGKHLLLIINDILDLAKIESGTVNLSLEAIDPAGVLADAGAMAQALAKRRQIELRTTIRARRAVLADTDRLRQVLLNLLSNAIKYSPNHSAVDVLVTDAGEFVRFAITDRGPGIAPEIVQRLFQPFVQGEGALQKAHQGTGLGLAISKKLVDLHGGAIRLESKVGVGTTAVIDIPAAGRKVRATASPPTAPCVLLVATGGPPRPTRRRLEAAGYRVEVVSAHEDLIAAAHRSSPALIVIEATAGDDVDSVLMAQVTELSSRLPVLLCSEEPKVMAAKPIDADALRALCRRLSTGDGRRTRVLVVDDDPSVSAVVTAALGEGYVVTAAATMGAGLARAFEERFDLIIIDLGLPDGSGLELIDALHENERTRGVPRVVLTAAQLDEAQLARLRKHTAAVAQKGAVTPDELLSVVDRLTAPAVTAPASAAHPSILVVDDNDMNRDLVRSILERLGYTVIQARDGVEALAIAERERPQLILMDLAMSGMDGFEATRQLRQHPTLRTIPVVAVSALARRSDEEEARAAGVDDFLTKPIDRVALERVVARYLTDVKA